MINRRLGERLGRSSHSVEMRIADSQSFECIVDLLCSNKTKFVAASKKLTRFLVSVQTSGAVHSGSALFVNGECFYKDAPCSFAAVIKADNAEALRPDVKEDGENVLQYYSDLLFAEGARLLKIGFFILKPDADTRSPRPEDFIVFIFDHMLNESGSADAAKYFYQSFLGCCRLTETPKKVREVFQAAHKTIWGSKYLSDVKKVEADQMLKCHFKNQTRALINPFVLAKEIFGHPEDHDAFLEICKKKNCADTYGNDTSLLVTELKIHRVKIRAAGSDLTLSGSTDVMSDKEVVEITRDSDNPGWLLIRVKGKLIKS